MRFELTDDPYQWLLPTGRLELVHIEGIYVADVAFSGGRWERQVRFEPLSSRNSDGYPGYAGRFGTLVHAPQRLS